MGVLLAAYLVGTGLHYTCSVVTYTGTRWTGSSCSV